MYVKPFQTSYLPGTDGEFSFLFSFVGTLEFGLSGPSVSQWKKRHRHVRLSGLAAPSHVWAAEAWAALLSGANPENAAALLSSPALSSCFRGKDDLFVRQTVIISI